MKKETVITWQYHNQMNEENYMSLINRKWSFQITDEYVKENSAVLVQNLNSANVHTIIFDVTSDLEIESGYSILTDDCFFI